MINRNSIASMPVRLNPALGVLLVLLALFGLTAPTAHAATLTVMSINDGVANASLCPGIGCRLRDAIAKANPGDTITFNFSGTILLTQGQLAINKDLTIHGLGYKFAG